MSDLNNMSDYDRGEYDCIHGHPARECENENYYYGYGDAYSKEQCRPYYSDDQMLEIMRGER